MTLNIIIHEENCTGCSICRLICSFTHKKGFKPSEAFILIDRFAESGKIKFTDECTNCGLCVKHCLYSALEMEEK